MNESRCPLVREIEEAEDTRMYSAASDLVSSKYWPRIREALEAAEEMATVVESMGIGVPRYRAAASAAGITRLGSLGEASSKADEKEQRERGEEVG